MPTSPPRLCPRCRQPTRGRCQACDPAWSRKPQSWTGGSTRRWRNLRANKMRHNLEHNHGLCEHTDCRSLATEVHHHGGITTEADRYDSNRLQALCRQHHAQQTAEQSRAARHRT